MVLRFPLTLLFLFLIFNNSFIVIAEEGEISNENVVSTGNEGEPRPPSRSPVSEENSEKPAEEDEKNSAFEKEDDVYILTDDNFDKFLEKNPTTFIEFYAPWCGHCKKLAPEYSIAARILRPSVLLAKLDATVQKKVAEKYEVKSYPTLKLFKEGEEMPIDFDGERDSSSIVQWVQLKTDPNYKPPKEEVITLTAENFDEFVADKPIMLVEFYAPWCGHCKQLAPEYEQAAKLLKPHNIPLAKVDATVEKKLADQYGVQGYPTLKILRNGRRFDYNGPRNAFGILNHMMLQASPAATELKTLKKVKSFMPAEDVAIIGFFEVDEGKYFEAFMDAAEKTRNDFTVGYTKSDALRQHFNAKKNSIVIFYPELFHSKFEPKSVAFERDPDDDLTEEDLVAFWQEHSTPLVGKKTRNNAATRYAKLPLVVVYYNADFSLQYREGSEYWRKKVLNVANKFKSQNFKFAVADEEEFTRELNDLGLGDSGLEHNVVVFGVDGKKYPMIGEEYEDGDLEENLTSFLNNINKGKVKPYVKSAPVPKSDSGPVRTLVGSNFAKIVNDDSKDVLIEFYAPWCGHCQNFEPKYKQFAAKLKKERPNLIVAKMDATANDAPSEYAIEGFPTIYLAPSGKKDKPIKYTGNRELADLEKFVHENSVVSFLTAKEEL